MRGRGPDATGTSDHSSEASEEEKAAETTQTVKSYVKEREDTSRTVWRVLCTHASVLPLRHRNTHTASNLSCYVRRNCWHHDAAMTALVQLQLKCQSDMATVVMVACMANLHLTLTQIAVCIIITDTVTPL